MLLGVSTLSGQVIPVKGFARQPVRFLPVPDNRNWQPARLNKTLLLCRNETESMKLVNQPTLLMSRTILIAILTSLAIHLGGYLSASYMLRQHSLVLTIPPAQQINVQLTQTIIEPVIESAIVPVTEPVAKKSLLPVPMDVPSVITTTGPADTQTLASKKKPEPKEQEAPVPPEKKPELQQKALVKREPESSSDKNKSPQQPPRHLVPENTTVTGQQAVASQQVKPSPGAGSEYRLVEPRFAGRPVQPEYPYQARRMGHEGTVMVEVKLSAQGKIVSTEIVGSSGYLSLDKAAVKAVSRWQLLPLMEGDRGIPSRVKVPVRFKLG